MKASRTYRIMISGGGTGGHIYPAIAIANAFKALYPDTKFLFVGAKGKMEMEKVPEAGFEIVGLWISGIQRKWTLDHLFFPFKLISSVWKSFKLLTQFKPDAVIGVGGYASGALLFAAVKKNIPTLIQEQNSYPGITNKFLAHKVNKICVAYSGMERFFPKEKILITGNPVRTDIRHTDSMRLEGLSRYGLRSYKKTLLVLGGSLGARTINDTFANLIAKLLDRDIQIIWQTGKFYFEEMKKRTAHIASEKLILLSFIKEMDKAYAAADVVISRAGALSISELCLVGKPTILVPSPNVTDDHQTKNAMSLVNKNAAWIVADQATEHYLINKTIILLEDNEAQEKLKHNIKALARPDATTDIATQITQLIKCN